MHRNPRLERTRIKSGIEQLEAIPSSGQTKTKGKKVAICNGCGDQDKVETWRYPDGTKDALCAECASDAGFCLGCGHFMAGVESFDTNPLGICYDCMQELREETDEFIEDDDGFVY